MGLIGLARVLSNVDSIFLDQNDVLTNKRQTQIIPQKQYRQRSDIGEKIVKRHTFRPIADPPKSR